MDPVSVVSLVGSVASLIILTGRVAINVHNIVDKCSGVTTVLKKIENECTMLEGAFKLIKNWIEREGEGAGSVHFRDEAGHLENAIGICEASLKDLEAEIDKIASSSQSASKLSLKVGAKTKLKFLWNEDIMRGHLEDVRWQGSTLHLLLSASKLSPDLAQRQIRQVSRSASIRFARRDDNNSIYSTKTIGFEDAIANSEVYKRVNVEFPRKPVNTPSGQSSATLIASEIGSIVLVTQDYHPDAHDHLQLNQGDFVKILKITGSSIWYGELNDQGGFFSIECCDMSISMIALRDELLRREVETDPQQIEEKAKALFARENAFAEKEIRIAQEQKDAKFKLASEQEKILALQASLQKAEADFQSKMNEATRDLLERERTFNEMQAKASQDEKDRHEVLRSEQQRLLQLEVKFEKLMKEKNQDLAEREYQLQAYGMKLMQDSLVAHATTAGGIGPIDIAPKPVPFKRTLSEKDGFFQAVKLGDSGRLRDFLLRSPDFDVNAPGPAGTTALRSAIEEKNVEMVGLLLGRGAKTTVRNNRGLYALAIAISLPNPGTENIEIVRLLLKYGCNVNITGPDYRPILFSAVNTGQEEIAKMLLEAGSILETAYDANLISVFHLAAKFGFASLLGTFVAKGLSCLMVDRWKNAPLHYAAGHGQEGACLKLLDLMSNNALTTISLPTNYEGCTPLHTAAQTGTANIIQLLMGVEAIPGKAVPRKAGASKVRVRPFRDHRAENGVTALHIAARYGKLANAVALIENGVDFTIRDAAGLTCLHYAVREGHTDLCAVLIEMCGYVLVADVRDVVVNEEWVANDATGSSPLHFAIEQKNKAIVSLLIEKGAGLEVRNNEGTTPLRLAYEMDDGDYFSRKGGDREIIDILERAGARV